MTWGSDERASNNSWRSRRSGHGLAVGLSAASGSTRWDIDTYCGVDGNGNALPAYFGKGKGSRFCRAFLPIFEAPRNANSPAAVLAALDADKTQIAQLATEVSAFTATKAKASATVGKAQTAITQNSAASLSNRNGNGPSGSGRTLLRAEPVDVGQLPQPPGTRDLGVVALLHQRWEDGF